ncbi:major facilitator superfamily domain-containing protein [Chytriomyces sp. MP71]|nr:major facilitator superfamily domain-containing protein [Chytriomyces sp. MP71]
MSTAPFKDKTSQTLLLLLTVLPEAIVETMLAPLIPFMIRSLSTDISPDRIESEIGGRSGLLMASFYFPLLVMNILWGTLSDSMGRKGILLAGLFVCTLTTLMLGINTTSFTVALLCRFIAGVFGGNSTVAKGGLGEIWSDEEGRSWAYSAYGSLYAISGICGPVIGGLLVSNPAHTASVATHPYFNTCLFGAILSAVAFLVAQRYFFEPKELLFGDVDEHRDVDSSASAFKAENGTFKMILGVFSANGIQHLIVNLMEPVTPKLMFPILLYVLIAFCNMSVVTILPLLFAAEPQYGGLGFSPLDASFAMTVSAVAELGFQTIMGQWLVLTLGLNRTYCLGMAVVVPACLLVGALGGSTSLAGWYGIMLCMVLFGFVNAIAYLSVIMMISDSVPSASLGAAHGLAATCAAVVRTLSPPLSGWAWSFASTVVRVPVAAFLITHAVAVFAVVVVACGGPTMKGSRYHIVEDVEMDLMSETDKEVKMNI